MTLLSRLSPSYATSYARKWHVSSTLWRITLTTAVFIKPIRWVRGDGEGGWQTWWDVSTLLMVLGFFAGLVGALYYRRSVAKADRVARLNLWVVLAYVAFCFPVAMVPAILLIGLALLPVLLSMAAAAQRSDNGEVVSAMNRATAASESAERAARDSERQARRMANEARRLQDQLRWKK